MRRAKRRKRTPAQQALAQIKEAEKRRKPWERQLARIAEQGRRRPLWKQILDQAEADEKRRHALFEETFCGERETVEDMMARAQPAETVPSAPVKQTEKKKNVAAAASESEPKTPGRWLHWARKVYPREPDEQPGAHIERLHGHMEASSTLTKKWPRGTLQRRYYDKD